MIKIPNQADLIKYLVCSLALILALSVSVLTGVKVGENNINAQWSKEKLATKEAMLVLQGEIQQKEFGHRQETTRISDQLRNTEVRYEEATSALAAEHSKRLQLSAQRAASYVALTETGSDQCRSVASHAAGLDLALEEGRGLVGELKEALGRRDDQLRLLGAQINNDRKLLDK